MEVTSSSGEVASDSSSQSLDIRTGETKLQVYRDPKEGDVQHRFVGCGAGAMASLVFVSDMAAGQIAPLRTMLPDTAGVSLLHPDVLVLRLLAPDSFALRRTLIPILTRLNGGPLPRCWTL